MRIEFTASRDERYWRQLLRDRLRSGSEWRWALPWLLLLAVVLCFASRTVATVVAGGAVLLVLVGLAQAYLFPVRRTMKRLPPRASDPRRVACDADGVTLESDLVTSRYAWGAFTHARRTPYAYLLFSGSDHYVDLPRTDLTGDQDEQLGELLADCGLLPTDPPAG